MFNALNRVFTRILLLAVLAVGALGMIGYFSIQTSRANLFEQKRREIQHLVESAVTIVADLAKRADAGEMTREQAQAEAKRVISSIRFGNNDYVFAYDFAGFLLVNPVKPELIGTNRLNERDPTGKAFIQEFIAMAKKGGGHVSYVYQLPQSTQWVDKFSYASGYVPWGWMIATGVLVEDVDTMHWAMSRNLLISLGAVGLVLLVAAVVLTR
jgi:methyl-accepting chemotaxis protein